jgi:hypothetical protein
VVWVDESSVRAVSLVSVDDEAVEPLRSEAADPDPPPLWRAWMASISCPLGMRAVPVMPRPAAIDRSSGSTMADKPSPRVRRFAPLAEAADASPAAGADVVDSLMVSVTVILSGIQPIGPERGAQRTEGSALV